MASNVEPMSEADRRELVKIIEKRKSDLLEKRKLLENISGGSISAATEIQKLPSHTGGPSISIPPASSLLNDVMAAVSAAAKAAENAPPSISSEKDASKPSKMDGQIESAVMNARYSRALKRVIGSLGQQAAAVDVMIIPKTIERFDKSCQCHPLPQPEVTPVPVSDVLRPLGTVGHGLPSSTPTQVTAEEVKKWGIPSVVQVDRMDTSKIQTQHDITPLVELSSEEKKKLIFSSTFETFFNKASKTVERALGEAELFGDYSNLHNNAQPRSAGGEPVRRLQAYADQRWSHSRAILDVRTHPIAQELFLVAYGQRADASASVPDGCALIWNVTMTQRAESIFCCQSQVCTAMVDPYRPHCVVGGTFTGAIVIWDSRAKVYSMEVVGTEHAHNLVSVDTDGRLCLWSMAMMIQPTETVDLKKASKDVSCLCMGFADGENNSFLGGTDNGSLFLAQIHGSKAGIVESYTGHVAPVTSIDWHPTSSDAEQDYSDLVLSSSFDWSVKLWSPKFRGAPLHSFEAATDYCLDAEWHPRHPAVFASCQSDGALHIWDIAKDLEVPDVIQPTGAEAITKLKWANDGMRLMTGDTQGVVTVWGASNDISKPRTDDYTRFGAKIEELKTTEISSKATNRDV